MVDKIKKISINAFERAVNDNYEGIKEIEWNGLTLAIKHNLTLKDMLAFVDTVVKNCFSTDEATYMPEVKDFAIRSCIIEYYTNIALPSNVERRYDLLYHSSILDAIMPHLDKSQFNAMIESIEEKAEHLAQANIESVTKQMNELCTSFENAQKQFENTFSGIDKDSIVGILNALSNGMDESKVVQAIIEARNNKGE